MLADLEDLDDVGVVDRRDGAGLGLEPGEVAGARAGAGADHLERDQAVEPGLPRLVDDPHAAGAQHPQDLVARDPGQRVVLAAAGRSGEPFGVGQRDARREREAVSGLAGRRPRWHRCPRGRWRRGRRHRSRSGQGRRSRRSRPAAGRAGRRAGGRAGLPDGGIRIDARPDGGRDPRRLVGGELARLARGDARRPRTRRRGPSVSVDSSPGPVPGSDAVRSSAFIGRCPPSGRSSPAARSRSYLSNQASVARPRLCSMPDPAQKRSRSATEQGAAARAARSSAASETRRPAGVVGQGHRQKDIEGSPRPAPARRAGRARRAAGRVAGEGPFGRLDRPRGRRARSARRRRRERRRPQRAAPLHVELVPRTVRTQRMIRGQANCSRARLRPASPIRCRSASSPTSRASARGHAGGVDGRRLAALGEEVVVGQFADQEPGGRRRRSLPRPSRSGRGSRSLRGRPRRGSRPSRRRRRASRWPSPRGWPGRRSPGCCPMARRTGRPHARHRGGPGSSRPSTNEVRTLGANGAAPRRGRRRRTLGLGRPAGEDQVDASGPRRGRPRRGRGTAGTGGPSAWCESRPT